MIKMNRIIEVNKMKCFDGMYSSGTHSVNGINN